MTKIEDALRKRERAKRAWIKAERAYIDANAEIERIPLTSRRNRRLSLEYAVVARAASPI